MTAQASTLPDFKQLPFDLLDPSKTNPRKNFPPTYITELAGSIREKGILEPLLVRKKKNGRYEIIAGECRYRANKQGLAEATKESQDRSIEPAKQALAAEQAARLKLVPCLVRQISDPDALEIQAMENIHRMDLTPLEEAQAYRNLINTKPDKHSATTIATRVGKSPSWVWDIMKLLDLVPDAKKLLERGKMTVNHAIPIARLTPDQQKLVIDPHSERGGLFTGDHGLFDEDDPNEKDPWSDMKARSVRELNAWINHHIRFDVKQAAKAAPLEFEEVAAKVEVAAAKPGRGNKVIAITYDYQVHPDAKSDERVYTERSWKRADGSKGTTSGGYGKKMVDSPTCGHSVLGTVVAGRDRGQAFEVCIAKEKCTVHYGPELKAKAKRLKEKETQAKGGKPKKAHVDKWELDQQRQREQRQREEALFVATIGPLRKAVQEKLDVLPEKLSRAQFAEILRTLSLPKDTKPVQLGQAILTLHVKHSLRRDWSGALGSQKQWALLLGVNVKAIETQAKAKVKEVAAKVQTSGEAK